MYTDTTGVKVLHRVKKREKNEYIQREKFCLLGVFMYFLMMMLFYTDATGTKQPPSLGAAMLQSYR